MRSPASPPPLLGRRPELDRLLATLGNSSVVVFGPAGIGKTRLASAAIDELTARGVQARRIRGSRSDRSLPLQALAPILGEAHESTVSADAVARIHQALQLGPTRPGAGDPVILVDDANLLDDRSVAILGQLLDAGRVRLLCTVRTGEADAPDSRVVSSPDLGSFVGLLRRDDLDRLTLGPMANDDLGALTESIVGGAVDGRSKQTLVDTANGNPLLLRELIFGAREAGTFVDRGNLWMLNGPLRSTVVLDELVSERLGLLSDEARHAAEVLAVAGRLRLDLFAAAAPLEVIEQLERAAMVSLQREPHQVVDFAHPIYRDVIRQRLGAVARLRCHRELVTLATSVKDPTPDEELQFVVWQMLAGEKVDSIVALRAAKRASEQGDSVLAGDLALLSYRATPTGDAAILAGWCLGTTGRQADADAIAAEALNTLTEPDVLAALVLRRAEERWWWQQDCDGARSLLDDGLRSLPRGPWVDLLRAQESVFCALDGACGASLAIGSEFIEHELTWVRRTASIGLAFGLLGRDQVDEAIAVSDRAYAEALTDPAQELSGDASIHIISRLFAGLAGPDAASTLSLAETVYAVAAQQPSQHARGWASLILSIAQFAVGRPLAAARSAREAELLWRDLKIEGLARWSATSLGLSHAMMGDITAASEALERVDMYRDAGFRLNTPYVERLRATIAAAKGDRQRATRLLADAAQAAIARGTLLNAAECVHEMVRLQLNGPEIRQALNDLRSAKPDGHGPFLAAQLKLLDGVARQKWATVEDAADSLANAGRLLFAAEAYRLVAANDTADRARASRCSARSVELLQHCENVGTPILSDTTRSDVLSAREREVSRLAAEGLTNREIATRLVVSERTVESHLYRVFTKLGVTTRAELAERASML